MVNNTSSTNETMQQSVEDFNEEKYSLRRFLVGITATTFGVLVALHPNTFTSNASRWLYVISIVANALSLVLLIASLSGRYFMLREKGYKLEKDPLSINQSETNYPKYSRVFKPCAILGISFYVLSIVLSCSFIFIEVLP